MLEKDTRQHNIDAQIRAAGWDFETQVDQERLVRYASTSRIAEDPSVGFSDYVLKDRAGLPIAVVEAKRTSRYSVSGKEQAADYAAAIKHETGREPFIFLANGNETLFWQREWAAPRPVQGFFTLDDLETLQYQAEHRGKLVGPGSVMLDTRIVDRPYQHEAIRRVYERLEVKHRKFLLVLATGTGKTRLAMALIDGLMRANWVRRVLFLVDRRVLAEQAMDDFKAYLPNVTRARIEAGELDSTARAFVATYPSMMEVIRQRQLSPGFFNLVICDESHRSIYNRYRELLTYFDSYQLGLTATPVDAIERNTFQLFGCPDEVPTFSFPFEDAVNHVPPYLNNYKVYGAQTRFQLRGIRAGELPPEVRQQVTEQGVTLAEVNFEGTDLERRVTNSGTDRVLVHEFMERCIKDEVGNLPGKSIIFAMSHRHALNLMAAFDELYPSYRGEVVAVIDSQMERAEETLRKFKHDPLPRVAISVDMLDTGVDIREVVNLVFAKPVYSRVKFWQMIGRGTRLLDPNQLKPWCRRKDYFLIIDYWDNFAYFGLHPDGAPLNTSESLPVRRFRTQVDLLERLVALGQSGAATSLSRELRHALKSLGDFADVRAAQAQLDIAQHAIFWHDMGAVEFIHLRDRLAPLLRFRSVNEESESFALKCEQLALAVLVADDAAVLYQLERVRADLKLLPDSLQEVRAHEPARLAALSLPVSRLSYALIVGWRDTFAPLMRYRRSRSTPLVELSIADHITERRWITFGPAGEGTYVETYRAEVEAHIRELAADHPAIAKIKRGQAVSDDELEDLAATLNQADLFITPENLRLAFDNQQAELVDLIRHALGLIRVQSRSEQIAAAFDGYLAGHQQYGGDQMLFLRTVRSVLVQAAERGQPLRLDPADFDQPPFTRLGRGAAARLFTPPQLADLLSFIEELAA